MSSDSSNQTPKYWRTLDDLASMETVAPEVAKEFPISAQFWLDQPSRRGFLQRMAASLALAGLTGCVRQPSETIVPSVQEPENRVPGRPQYFATAMPTPGGAMGILVENHDGRPTKIEGNPLHPASLGATDTHTQASVLDLYDPDRSQVVLYREQISSWPTFLSMLQPRIESHRSRQGAGLHILTERSTSPTLLRQLKELFTAMPQATWYAYEPFSRESAHRGTELAFGKPLDTLVHLDQADVILSVDADFLETGPGKVRLAREFGRRRRVASGQDAMNRLYVAESTRSLTGANADHRLPLRPSQLIGVLLGVAKALDVSVGNWETAGETVNPQWVDAVAQDLKAAGSRGVVLVGDSMPVAAHVIGHALNAKLGSLGTCVTTVPRADRQESTSSKTIDELGTALQSGGVETLLILGGNPAFDAPAHLQMRSAIGKAAVSIHLGTHVDETAFSCLWHVPAAHYLESWGDVRSEDGTASVIQPLIAPLYNGKSSHELLEVVLGRADKTAYDAVRDSWRQAFGEAAFEKTWKKSLHDGVIEGSAFPAESATLGSEITAELEKLAQEASGQLRGNSEIELVFRPHPTVGDGRYANNGWLQELPQPLSSLTWCNAAFLSPTTAASLQVATGDVVSVTVQDQEAQAAVYILPGQPEGVMTLHAGQGRSRVGRNGKGVGTDVYGLRWQAPWWTSSGKVTATGRRTKFAQTQEHHLMEGRDLVRTGTLAEFKKSPDDPSFMHVGHHGDAGNVSLYPDWKQEGPQWGMSINLGACFGCSACVIACQSENNIPIVGPDQVANSREMHWLKIDTYFSGEPEDPSTHFQPQMCMQCEHAPCEPVCPVGATTHSPEGLNEMTYNRCIGTRYCSNNCPYKARRFNFLDYRTELKELPVIQLQQNPDVSVRSRGVMEKCTFCVQRINGVRIQAEMDGREIREGEIVTACQAVCPSQAITFGNIRDAESAVSKEKASSLNYALLEELNTRPRLTYLAAVKNPHPALAPASAETHHDGGGH